jgi:hypothetical protein
MNMDYKDALHDVNFYIIKLINYLLISKKNYFGFNQNSKIKLSIDLIKMGQGIIYIFT